MLLVLELSATVRTVEEEGLTVSTPMLSHFSFSTEYIPSLFRTFQLLSTRFTLAFFLSMFHTAWMNAGLVWACLTLFGVEGGSTSMLDLALFVLAIWARLTVSSFGHRRYFLATKPFLHQLSLFINRHSWTYCALRTVFEFAFEILSCKAVAVVVKAYLAFASLVQFDSADICGARVELEMVTVFLVMLLPVLHHEAPRAAWIGALDNQSVVDGHAILVQRHKLFYFHHTTHSALDHI